MDQIASLAQVFDHTASIIEGIRPDQLGTPTPCTEWDVATLAGHCTGVVASIGSGVSGQQLVDVKGYELGDDPAAQFRAEADRTLAAWTAHGLDGEVNIGAGPMPAAMAIGINLVDTSAHSWDLATATGQDSRLPDELAVALLAAAQGFVSDELRSMVGFNPPVSVGDHATPTDRFVAFLGRNP